MEKILGISGGPPVLIDVGGEEFFGGKNETAIYLGGPWNAWHVVHDLVHWHMVGPWVALPQGAEEGLAVIISCVVFKIPPRYGQYEAGDEEVLGWSTQRWHDEATEETYQKAARSILAVGIPDILARYAIEVPAGFDEVLGHGKD